MLGWNPPSPVSARVGRSEGSADGIRHVRTRQKRGHGQWEIYAAKADTSNPTLIVFDC